MKEPTTPFGIALRTWRRGNKASGALLGEQLGVAAAVISQLELGPGNPSKAMREKLRAVGFTYDFDAAEQKSSKQRNDDQEEVQFTEAELERQPYAHDKMTVREYHTLSYLVSKNQLGPDDFTVPVFEKASYFVEAFHWFRDSRVSYNTFVGELTAELDAPVKSAAEDFYASLLVEWPQLPAWQRFTIKTAAADSLRADEVWLAQRNCFVRRRDKVSVGAPLTNMARRTFQELEAMPNPYDELHPSLVQKARPCQPDLRPAARIS